MIGDVVEEMDGRTAMVNLAFSDAPCGNAAPCYVVLTLGVNVDGRLGDFLFS